VQPRVVAFDTKRVGRTHPAGASRLVVQLLELSNRRGSAEFADAALRQLDLSYNQLAVIPESFGHSLTLLEQLNLSNNQLCSVPDSLSLLLHLTELNLSHNQLTQLPESMGQLTKLQQLNLSANLLVSLPDTLTDLAKLSRDPFEGRGQTIQIQLSFNPLSISSEVDFSNEDLVEKLLNLNSLRLE
jgi:Leucine-rich repeat (LRR) protein